jgi:hypothetical protein
MSKDDTAVNDEVFTDDTAPESAPEETTESVEVDAFTQGMNSDIDPDDMPTEESDEEPEESEDENPEESEEPEAVETEEPRQDNDPVQSEWEKLNGKSQERFRQKVNEANELRQQLEAIKAKESQVATEQELLNEVNPETGDYYTIAEAERAARLQYNETAQQQYAQERYQLEVQQNQQKIQSEAQQALGEFPELDSQSDKFDAEIAAEYEQALSQALILDQQGVPIGAYMSPYQLAKSIAGPAKRAAEKAKALGQAEAQKATSRMLASADSAPSASSAKPKGQTDPFMSGFNDTDY